MSANIAVCSFGRKQSQRCPNKMLRPFAETTLTDLILEKLARGQWEAFFAGYEEAFERKSRQHGVRFVQRDERSATIDEPIVEILSFLRGLPYEHFLLVSACSPFLRVDTIQRFLDDCLAHDCQPAFSVARRRDYFMTLKGEPINFDPAKKTINTKTVEPIYEFCHMLYFFNRDYFFTHGTYWDWRQVRLIELPDGVELVDIDTEEDFILAETLWRLRPSDVELATKGAVG